MSAKDSDEIVEKSGRGVIPDEVFPDARDRGVLRGIPRRNAPSAVVLPRVYPQNIEPRIVRYQRVANLVGYCVMDHDERIWVFDNVARLRAPQDRWRFRDVHSARVRRSRPPKVTAAECCSVAPSSQYPRWISGRDAFRVAAGWTDELSPNGRGRTHGWPFRSRIIALTISASVTTPYGEGSNR